MKFSQKLVLFAALFAAVLLAASGQTHAALVVAFGGASAAVPWSQYQAQTFAINGFFGRVFSGPLLDEEGGRGGGGGTHAKVLEAVEEIKASNADIVKNYEQWQKESKATMEDFHKMTKRLESVETISKQIEKLQGVVARERSLNYGDPAEAIARDPQRRAAFLALMGAQMGNTELRARIFQKYPDAAEVHKNLIKRSDAFGGYEAKAIYEGATPGSAYIDTNEVERDIFNVLGQYGAFNTVDYRTISAKATEIPIKTARPKFQFVSETSQTTPDSTKAGSRVTLTPGKATCIITASREVIEDDVVGLIRDLMTDFGEAGAYLLDYITFAASNSSAGDDGGFTGMFSGGTSVVAASTHVSVATLTVDDFTKTMANAPVGVLQRPNTRWWMNPTIMVKTLYIKDGQGRPIFQTLFEAPNAGSIGSILGKPVTLVAAAPSTDNTSSKIAAFGDPNAFALRVRRSFDMMQSDHYAFDLDEIAWRATVRAGAKIKIATGIQVLTTAAS